MEEHEKGEMRDHYDFGPSTNPVRGKYAKAFADGVNVVKLDDDVAKHFPDSVSVNAALRTLFESSNQVVHGG